MSIFLILFSLLGVNPASADTDVTSLSMSSGAKVEKPPTEELRTQLQFRPGAVAVMGVQSRQTIGAGLGLNYGLSPKWAFGSSIRHGTDATLKTDKAFTGFDIHLAYSFRGGMVITPEDMNETSYKKFGGWRLQALVSQYYFSAEVTPYSGLGFGASYEIPASYRMTYVLGGRLDRVSNGNADLYPLEAYAGIGYRL